MTDPLSAFAVLDLRVGRVVRAEPNDGAKVPAFRLWIDFGPLGELASSAQLTARYRPETLVGRQVVAAVNLGPKRIGGFRSDVLVLGVADAEGKTVLLGVDDDVPPGGRIH